MGFKLQNRLVGNIYGRRASTFTAMGEAVNLVVIDDQISYVDAFGLALSLTPDLELAGRAANAEDGERVTLAVQPDLLVTDYRLPNGQTGTMLSGRLRDAGFTAPILVLTGFLAPQVIREAGEIDDLHVISKNTPMTGIVNAIRQIIKGLPIELDPDTTPDSNLSPGELEVLERLSNGQTPAEIAQMLHLSVHSIRARIKSMHRKLNVASQGEAIATAIRLGLVVPPK